MNTTLDPALLMFRGAMELASDPRPVHFGAASRSPLTPKIIREAFGAQELHLSPYQIRKLRVKIEEGVRLAQKYPGGNSQIGMAAVEIGQQLNLDMVRDGSVKNRIEAALKEAARKAPQLPEPGSRVIPAWNEYFDQTVNLTANSRFLQMTRDKGFSPVKISWEDIGRYEGSVWGNRISDVGIWVRKDESDPGSAKLALSVRRDNNFRDKVLVVPADNIKIHVKQDGQTREFPLPQRLRQLGLTSEGHDRNVIVSNQFAVVPVPSKDMKGAWKEGVPPRAAFNFSIYPYGSKNFVITDVIEGSSNAVVGPGGHQLLYANIDGQKAPFTASRAEDRQDLLQMERELKAKGMDVDVQRYYLIQIPLKQEAPVRLSNMGEPPRERSPWGGGIMPMALSFGPESMPIAKGVRAASLGGLDKVAIGHGETEGPYNEGAGYRGQRAEEPIRVTVCYFVTPKGEVTDEDMRTFTRTFEQWDKKAIWGGSFVVPDDKSKP